MWALSGLLHHTCIRTPVVHGPPPRGPPPPPSPTSLVAMIFVGVTLLVGACLVGGVLFGVAEEDNVMGELC